MNFLLRDNLPHCMNYYLWHFCFHLSVWSCVVAVLLISSLTLWFTFARAPFGVSCWYKHLVSLHCGHKIYFIWFPYSLNLKNHFVVQEIFDPWLYHVCFTEIIWTSFCLLDGMMPTCVLEAFCMLWFGSS